MDGIGAQVRRSAPAKKPSPVVRALLPDGRKPRPACRRLRTQGRGALRGRSSMSETTTETREQAAARDLERAQRGVEEVLERIKDADELVGPEDLEKAQSRVRFAKARIEGLERKNQEEAERARRDRIGPLTERALALDPAHMRKLEEKARKALDAIMGGLST